MAKSTGSFYVVGVDSPADQDFAFFDYDPPGNFEQSDFYSGAPVTTKHKPLLVTSKRKKAQPISDVALTTIDIAIYSPKLRALLAELGATNIEYLPITFVMQGTKAKNDEYRIANVLGLVECVDLKHARIERSSSSGRIMSLEKFKILEKNVKPLPGMKTPPVLFRLAEQKRILIAHQVVKDACKSQGITGIEFTPTTEYS